MCNFVFRRAQLKKQVSVTFLPGLLTRKEIIIFKLPPIQDSIRTYISTTIDKLTGCWQVWNIFFNRIGGVMVCMFASSVVDHVSEHQSDQSGQIKN